MRSVELSEVQRWAEEVGAEWDEFDGKLRAVFEWHDPIVDRIRGVVERRPRVYVETNRFADQFKVEGGDVLEVVVEEWENGVEQDEYEREVVESTGTVGGETNVSVWAGELTVVETADNGWRRSITVRPASGD